MTQTEFARLGSLHELLTLALDDMRKVRRNPRYVLDMLGWHTPERTGPNRCFVCAAGAIMACSLKLPADQLFTIGSFEPPVADRFRAVDFLRQFRLIDAYKQLYPGSRIPEPLRELEGKYKRQRNQHYVWPYSQTSYRKTAYYWRRLLGELTYYSL